MFIISLMMYLMCALFVAKPVRLLTVKNFVLLSASVFVLQAATTGFYALRVAYWQTGQSFSRTNILELIPRAVKIYEDDRRGDLQASIRENLMSRTFVLRYLAEISRGVDSHEPLYGLDFHRALIVVTPSALYEGKLRDKLATVEEDLINPRFGLPAYDEANTILIGGLADFGVPGLFLYPILLCVVVSVILRGVARAPGAAQLVVGLVVLQTLLSVEADIAVYLESLRNLVLIAGMAWAVFGWAANPKPPLCIGGALMEPLVTRD
ncbi:MAG: hypothetical protein M3N50_14460 [Pseudomonadota bacterium]|nr:hypothetical protein [Pseudomonadota bacterium]